MTIACTLMTACAPADQASVTPAEIGLGGRGAAANLASATINTSPDGGIYRNPDNLTVIVAARGPAAPLNRRLNTSGEWSALDPLGALTFIGIRLRNDGKVGSDPRLNDLQVASDLAPEGTGSAPLRHFYHPMYPLAALGSVPMSTDCGIHIDPAQSLVVVLVYPPLRATSRVVWGRFGDFSLEFGLAGGLPPGTDRLHATVCVPPHTAP